MKPTLALILSLLFCLPIKAQTDQPGCNDPVEARRFPNSVIRSCQTELDMDYRVALGPETGYQTISEWENASGNATRRFYSTGAEYSVSKIYEHYKAQLQGSGFAILAEKLHPQRNISKLVGGNNWLRTFYRANRFSDDPEMRMDEGSMSPGGTFYVAGKKELAGGEAYLVVAGKKVSDDENIILVDLILPPGAPAHTIQARGTGGSFANRGGESTSFAPKTGAPLDRQLEESGRAIIYGIKYNFNKYVLKDESAPILDEIGDLLRQNPSLTLFVVSHTAAGGSWEDNLDLSFQRAESIVNYLQEYHQIEAKRLTPYGVGFMAPLASPLTPEGRSQNERIELLLR